MIPRTCLNKSHRNLLGWRARVTCMTHELVSMSHKHVWMSHELIWMIHELILMSHRAACCGDERRARDHLNYNMIEPQTFEWVMNWYEWVTNWHEWLPQEPAVVMSDEQEITSIMIWLRHRPLNESRTYLNESRTYMHESRTYMNELRTYMNESRIYMNESPRSLLGWWATSKRLIRICITGILCKFARLSDSSM